jgi:hypothetical protein
MSIRIHNPDINIYIKKYPCLLLTWKFTITKLPPRRHGCNLNSLQGLFVPFIMNKLIL